MSANTKRLITSGGVFLTFLLAVGTPSLADDRIEDAVKPTTDFSKPEAYEAMSAGATTSRKRVNADAFSHSSPNLALDQEMRFKLGNALFRKLWVSAPASTKSSDGLGPLFNARSCQRCHVKDGRGHPPPANTVNYDQSGMLVRLSVPAKTDTEKADIVNYRRDVVPEPTYGGQFQDFAIQGHAPEGKIHIVYGEKPVTLGDGTTVTLRVPTYELASLGYGPMAHDVMISPRIAPSMIGLGLLEMIRDKDILAHADPNDADGDSISGKVRSIGHRADGQPIIGRFGWKAGNATVRQQTGGAFSGDVGISNSVAPGDGGDCTARQTDCRNAPGGSDGTFEAKDNVLDLVTHYASHLAVPIRRDYADKTVLNGKKVFYESGCASCHVPKYVTRTEPDQPALSRQLIWPYTDLLLHDMGEGLADNRPEGDANGQEWRTPPLWGIGLTKTVSGEEYYLHDGRARSLLEAILWHGGEAEASKETVRKLDAASRDALIAFLESL